jgi:hypothetical protein
LRRVKKLTLTSRVIGEKHLIAVARLVLDGGVELNA